MEVSISVKQSARRRRSTTLRIVNRGELELLAPLKLSLSTIVDFISSNSKFLQKALTLPFMPKQQKQFSPGDIVSLFGEQIILQKSNQRKNYVHGENLFLSFRNTPLTRNKFYELIAFFLKEYISSRIVQLSSEMRLYPKSVRYKLVKSLWGSCSSRGNITFNKKLVHYPKGTIDYVIIHELAHLQVHNHSKTFWDLVALYCPDYTSHRKILREKKFG